MDVIYDPEAPPGAMRDIEELINSSKYVLGQPANPKTRQNCFVGLYKKS